MKNMLCVLILLITYSSYSQVVNIEKKRFSDSDKKLQGNIDLAFLFTHTNKDIFQIKNNLKLQYYNNRNLWLFFHNLSLMKANSESFINNGFQHIRYNYNFQNKWLIAEAFTQIQYNELQNLQRRFLWGAGSRFAIHDKKSTSIYSGVAIMYEFELLKDETHTDVIRNSCYLTLSFSVKKSLAFNHITYYQPRINYFNDFRISSETNMQIKILKNLNYKVSFNYSYDSKPPMNIQNLFYSLNNGISYKF